MKEDVINFVTEHWFAILLGIYEVFARIIRTKYNLSIVHTIVRIIDMLIPNFSLGMSKFKIRKGTPNE